MVYCGEVVLVVVGVCVYVCVCMCGCICVGFSVGVGVGVGVGVNETSHSTSNPSCDSFPKNNGTKNSRRMQSFFEHSLSSCDKTIESCLVSLKKEIITAVEVPTTQELSNSMHASQEEKLKLWEQTKVNCNSRWPD